MKSIPYVQQTSAKTKNNHISKSAKDCGNPETSFEALVAK
jgi:hypothetical protein